MPGKLTIQEMEQIALRRGGKCLSNVYTNSKTKLLWECKKGHKWYAIPNDIKRGSWCFVCGKKRSNEKRRLNIELMRNIAKERGGKCLSDTYVNSRTKLLWECSNYHRWNATPGSIRNCGHWCPHCAGLAKLSIEEMKNIAGQRGGKCLSDIYLNNRSKLLWECINGHQWKAAPGGIRSGQWCPVCAGTSKLSLHLMHQIAQERGGKCLSTKYVNIKTKLSWECSRGHKWEAIPGATKRGHWCPECMTGLGERICREFFQQIFHTKFPKGHPKWLISEKGYKMELDGYSKSLRIAFEHHGQEHYKIKNYTIKSHKDLMERQEKDKLKRKLCKQYNVILFEIPEIPTLLPIKNIKFFIKKKCEEKNVSLPNDFDTIQVDLKNAYCSFEADEMLNEVKRIAKFRGGKCLSDNYLNSQINLLWECAKGHRWEAPSIRIKSGYWCPHCAKNVRSAIEDMRKMAEERGGKCLSESYKNASTKLLWECSNFHRWNATPGSIRNSRRWCPYCAGLAKLSIEEMKKIAVERGGKCLSDIYLNKSTKLLWECGRGHQWEATPGSVKNGRKWCRICATDKRKLTIEEMKEIAKKRGGKCLSDYYVNSYSKLIWQCAAGHQWEATPDSIKRRGWCQMCRRIR